MTNGIDKKALFNLKSEPYLKPISDLGVGFYNLDENTAILRFQLSNEKGPLLIHENNLTAYAYFESSNGSASDVIELEVEDSHKGIVTITLDKEFLQASTATKVIGQVYIGVNNVDGNPEYNEVAVFREFTFEVADALINKVSSFTKIEYIRMFDQLKMRIEQKVREIEEAIANGADYVAEMKSVLQQGTETLNAIVADGKTDIQAYIAQAKTDLTKVKDDATEDITTTANNAKTSIQDTASTAVNSIHAKSTEATEHVDAKVIEFNQTVDDNGFLSPEILDGELEALEWQKYKLTEDNGAFKRLDVGTDILTLKAGSYESSGFVNDPLDDAGFYEVTVTESYNGRKVIHAIHSYSNRYFVKTIHTNGEDRGWKELTKTQSDTGWIPFNLINGAEGNTVYKNSVDNGFDNAYRIIKNGDTTIKALRVSARNLTQAVTFAELPSNFSKHTQVMPVRTPRDLNGGLVEIKPDGKLVFQYYNWKMVRDWIDTDYIYGEFSWIE